MEKLKHRRFQLIIRVKFIQNMVLSVAAFIAATDICIAQGFLNMPNDTIIKVGALEDLETLSIQQINNTKDTIVLKWSKVSEIVPNAWGPGPAP